MSSFCVFVKPTERRPRSTFVSLQRLGPAWKGTALRLRDPEAVGLRYPVVIGWSDFYGGTAAPVTVARATDGERTGWLVWGGSQGLRAVAADTEDEAPVVSDTALASVSQGAPFDERPILWLSDVDLLPDDVAAVVSPRARRERVGAGSEGVAADGGDASGDRGADARGATPG